MGLCDKEEQADTAAAAAKSLKLCLTLCSPIDGSPPGSPVPGILQARVLEWGAIAFSEADARDIAKKNNQYLDMAEFREGEVRTTQIRCPLYLACQNLGSEGK